jgi:hypothetical protein
VSPPVLLVLGVGKNVGLALLKKFKLQGYATVAVTRSPDDTIRSFANKVYVADLAGPPGDIEKI